MGTGSFDFQPYNTQLALDAMPIGVFQYFSVDKSYEYLPNIRCEQIQYKEGSDPPTARFSYILDELALANGWPTQFEQVWPINVRPGYSYYTVKPSWQLVVLAWMPDGSFRILFHGFARVPQADIAPESQHVTFTAVGVAVRCWDKPIGGRIQRSGADPNADKQKASDVQTDLPTRFNPAGTGTRSAGGILPNCTPKDKDVNVAYSSDTSGTNPYPVFLDSSIDRDPDPRTFWDLSKAVRYILATQNTAKDDADNLWVDNPDFAVMDSLLQNRRPIGDTGFFDPSDSSTYKTEENRIRDFDATNKPWPEVVSQLLGFYGFGMRFVCEDGNSGEPYNYIEIYRKDSAGPTDPKPVFLPSARSDIVDGPVNLAAFHAGFDYHGVANDIFIETHLQRDEISVVLAPLFKRAMADVGNSANYLRSAIDIPGVSADLRAKYRDYGVDECADGYWRVIGSNWITDNPFDFSPLFFVTPPDESPDDTPQADAEDDDHEVADPGTVPTEHSPDYCVRYRPGRGTLFSKDLNNKPRPYQLAISTDYNPAAFHDPPDFWEGTGTWQVVTTDDHELMKDRLGIRITADDLQHWKIGKPPNGLAPNGKKWPYPGGEVRAIKGQADPSIDPNNAISLQFFLRLTTVIASDRGIGTNAKRRDASPLKQTIQRRVDASDHFHLDRVDPSSVFNTTGGAISVVNDIRAAEAHASQLRTAHEFPTLTASLVIPTLVNYLQIGDRLGTINGRRVSLLVNAGSEQSEPASYPFVVAVTWDFQGEKQSTTIQLSDRRAEPRRPVA